MGHLKISVSLSAPNSSIPDGPLKSPSPMLFRCFNEDTDSQCLIKKHESFSPQFWVLWHSSNYYLSKCGCTKCSVVLFPWVRHNFYILTRLQKAVYIVLKEQRILPSCYNSWYSRFYAMQSRFLTATDKLWSHADPWRSFHLYKMRIKSSKIFSWNLKQSH